MTRISKKERQESIDYLRSIIKPGDTLHTKVTHVSRSGMLRIIEIFKTDSDGLNNISWHAARALEWGYQDKYPYGVKVNGVGMDMTFHLTYSLSSVLFPDGFTCLGESTDYKRRCPSNDHSNGDRNYKPHHHNSGGYALRNQTF